MTAPKLTFDEVIEAVNTWPRDLRARLVRAVERTAPREQPDLPAGELPVGDEGAKDKRPSRPPAGEAGREWADAWLRARGFDLTKSAGELFLGIARGEGPPPDDAAVKRWLEERRMERFG